MASERTACLVEELPSEAASHFVRTSWWAQLIVNGRPEVFGPRRSADAAAALLVRRMAELGGAWSRWPPETVEHGTVYSSAVAAAAGEVASLRCRNCAAPSGAWPWCSELCEASAVRLARVLLAVGVDLRQRLVGRRPFAPLRFCSECSARTRAPLCAACARLACEEAAA